MFVSGELENISPFTKLRAHFYLKIQLLLLLYIFASILRLKQMVNNKNAKIQQVLKHIINIPIAYMSTY